MVLSNVPEVMPLIQANYCVKTQDTTLNISYNGYGSNVSYFLFQRYFYVNIWIYNIRDKRRKSYETMLLFYHIEFHYIDL